MRENAKRFSENLIKIEHLLQRLTMALTNKRQSPINLQMPSQDIYTKFITSYMTDMVANPHRFIENQIMYWAKTMQHMIETQNALNTGAIEHRSENAGATLYERRFQNPLWEQHPFFYFLKTQYIMTAQAIEHRVDEIQGLDPKDKRKLDFFIHQIIDMMSPVNFLSTNPEALQKAVETNGESLIAGLTNLVRDVEENDGNLLVSLSDHSAFKVGETIATTRGDVVYQNRILELIHYCPTTPTVYQTPIVIFPPFINKYYILDLSPQNSLIGWLVEQGYNVFVVSWVNPNAEHAEVGIDEYINEGYLPVLQNVKDITQQSHVNAVGYCVGGTFLAIALALLKKRGDRSIKSATFFTTLIDFSTPGAIGAFLGDDLAKSIEAETATTGYLPKIFMAQTFSYLRPNELVYEPAVRNYMMGESPPISDVLYWNDDGTNLPSRFAVQYMRDFYENNLFARGDLVVCGETLSPKDVSVPIFAVVCERDHIVLWKQGFRSVQKFASNSKTIILSKSGHIFGIINPPMKEKYAYCTHSGRASTPDGWLRAATEHKGSWWMEWSNWLMRRSGQKRPTAQLKRAPAHAILRPAPGTYVLNKGH